jgi:hypothetical protein
MLSLWLPILVSTIALFFASFLSWMILQLHIKDWIKIDGEEKLMGAIGEMNIPDGNYMFPGATSGKEMNSPEHQEKFKAGPRGILQMLPEPTMGKNLGLTVLFFLACNATFAYLASFSLQPGTDFITVFRFVATIALLTFCASMLQHAIWFRNRVTGHVIESIAYALIAGAIFASLWPAA